MRELNEQSHVIILDADSQVIKQGSNSIVGFSAGDLKDVNGTTVTSDLIESATLTLSDLQTQAVINGRQDVDVKTYLDSEGNFSFELLPADNVVVSEDSNVRFEYHVVTLKFVSIAPDSRSLNFEIWIVVQNLRQVTNPSS